LHPRRRRETSSSIIPRLQPYKRINAKVSSITNPKGSSPHQSSLLKLHSIKTHNINNHRHCRQIGEASRTLCSSSSSQKTGQSVQAPSSPKDDVLKVATVVQQIMTELSEAVSEEEK
jgi:hypothetical protein